jgi:hypothetical protein
VAYDIIGGGEEGTKQQIRTKEDADHSLPYMIAALLDRAAQPAQYEPDRILGEDVHQLLKRIIVRPDPEYSAGFPAVTPAQVEVEFEDGTALTAETTSDQGFYTAPMEWGDALAKFDVLTGAFASEACLPANTFKLPYMCANRYSTMISPVTAIVALFMIVERAAAVRGGGDVIDRGAPWFMSEPSAAPSICLATLAATDGTVDGARSSRGARLGHSHASPAAAPDGSAVTTVPCAMPATSASLRGSRMLHRAQRQGRVRVGTAGPHLGRHPDRFHDFLRASPFAHS